MTSYGEAALVRSMGFLADAQSAVSNNIANVNTDGFKRRMAVATQGAARFTDMLGAELPAPNYVESTDWSKGTVRDTNSRLNVSIEGEGMFQVRSTNGDVLYTRSGELAIDSEGMLTTPNGDNYLDADGEPISMGGPGNPPGDFTVSPSGSINEDGGELRSFGNFNLVRFDNPTALQPVGAGLYRDTAGQTPSTEFPGLVRQRSLEGSNVQTVDELVRMMEVQRTFQATQRALSGLGRLHSSFVAMMNR